MTPGRWTTVALCGAGVVSVLAGACGGGADGAAVGSGSGSAGVLPPPPSAVAPAAPGAPGPVDAAPPDTAAPVPSLTPAQQDAIRAIVRADAGLAPVLPAGEPSGRLGPAYDESHRLVGGIVEVLLGHPVDLDIEVPSTGCYDGRQRRVLQRLRADGVSRLDVVVDLAHARVERVVVPPSGPPGDQPTIRRTTIRDLEPPGGRCRVPPGGY
ncbi:MAG: hypothetical protein ACRDZW_10515 [Acidimicrobiales bacterium]